MPQAETAVDQLTWFSRWKNAEGPDPLPDRPALRDPERTAYRRGDYRIDIFHWRRAGAPRLLLVHGIGMGHIVYDKFIAEIESDIEVIAIDLPGFGETPEPDAALSIPETADLLADALRHHVLSPVLAVGHSMGTQVVAELAVRHPSLVDRVVLIAPTVNASERSVLTQAKRMMQDLLQGQPSGVVMRGIISYLQTGLRWYAKKLGPTLEHRLEEILPRVTQPALVMRGSDDTVSPRGWAVRVTGLLPDGEMQQLEGRGHEALIASGEPAARRVLDWATAESRAGFGAGFGAGSGSRSESGLELASASGAKSASASESVRPR